MPVVTVQEVGVQCERDEETIAVQSGMVAEEEREHGEIEEDNIEFVLWALNLPSKGS